MTATLDSRVHVARRFQRAIRIDTDMGDQDALKGFVCPQSAAELLRLMARHVSESNQGAFTWTGPYGGGKSSLIVALGALLSSDPQQRQLARESIGYEIADHLLEALSVKGKSWQVLPIVGRREAPTKIIGAAIESAGLANRPTTSEWNDETVVQALSAVASDRSEESGGLIVFIDEMGKFLESAATDGSDIYLFQQLAEAASRSRQRLIIVGVLHQSFEEYANRLSRKMRDEWSKIQGRFVDLAVNVAGEEQLRLIAEAIETDEPSTASQTISHDLATIIHAQRKDVSNNLASTLEACWPLHPVTACLLGPISRRRFGQNQRSIFGFLTSSEPGGFRDFLVKAADDSLYTPAELWDYLRLNLEPSILASPDGHRWALAAEAVERCEGMESDPICVEVLKTIAVIDLFKERSGLAPTTKIIQCCFSQHKPGAIQTTLDWLQQSSLIIRKLFVDAYAVYAGSDFDIDGAVESAREELKNLDFKAVRELANLQPILAKRHYHQTGALRWFDIDMAPIEEVSDLASSYTPKNGAVGTFVLAIPVGGESSSDAQKTCRDAARFSDAWDVVVGLSAHSWRIPDLGYELIALEKVRTERPELAGDPVARREVHARLTSIQSELETELYQAFNTAEWYAKYRQPKQLTQFALNALASDLADRQYPKAPVLRNELLNRSKPSANARAAENALTRRMVTNTVEPRLGIEGFPAEGGLYISLLEKTGLHQASDNGAAIVSPLDWRHDPYRLAPLWREAAEYLKARSERTVSFKEIYDLWQRPPYGVKTGLMTILGVAFMLSIQQQLAIYREGVFQARVTELDIDYLVKDPGAVQLRWMDLNKSKRELLSGMSSVVAELNGEQRSEQSQPLNTARELVAIYDRIPEWSKRTAQLSANAKRIRDLFKRAGDPNKFLFDDLPSFATKTSTNDAIDNVTCIVEAVHDGLTELIEAYPAMLRHIRDTLLSELRVPNVSPQALAELRARAHNIRQLAGDFRLDAFIGRIAHFQGAQGDIEGIIGLAADKPLDKCVDPDIDRAMIEVADIARRFVRAESFAHVKGRADKRHSMAVILGAAARTRPLIGEFDVADQDRAAIDQLYEHLITALDSAISTNRDVALAALAKASAHYLSKDARDFDSNEQIRKTASS